MPRQRISSGSSFEEQIGYSRAVVDGDWIFVSGTTGFDYATMTIADGIEAQTEQCLANISNALAQAGSSLRDVVRVTYLVPVASEFEAAWPVLHKHFGAAAGGNDAERRAAGPKDADRDRGHRAPRFRRLKVRACRSVAAVCSAWSARFDPLRV